MINLQYMYLKGKSTKCIVQMVTILWASSALHLQRDLYKKPVIGHRTFKNISRRELFLFVLSVYNKA